MAADGGVEQPDVPGAPDRRVLEGCWEPVVLCAVGPFPPHLLNPALTMLGPPVIGGGACADHRAELLDWWTSNDVELDDLVVMHVYEWVPVYRAVLLGHRLHRLHLSA